MNLEQTLGERYRIERELGRGGMGTVYLARDLRLERLVALKVLPPEYASDGALRERLRETRMAASFSHPNIVPVHAVEEHDDVLAFSMGYIEGESLADRVRRTGPLDPRTLARLLTDVAYALAYAHGRGVVHRDVKPDNIMIDRATGRALLMDFGISRTISTAVEKAGLTRVGEVVGTPEFMSPEQATGDRVDGRSDLYSLGLVAHFALTGHPPITGSSTQQVILRQLTEALPPLATVRADVPAALAEAIDRCVQKDPAARYERAESLVEALDNAQLAAPEIPIPIRLFTQEAGTLGLVVAFLFITTWMFTAMQSSRNAGSADMLLPPMMLFGVALTRVLQARAEARRLVRAGFAVPEVQHGMRAVLEEREVMRAQLRGDADVVQRRRRTLRTAMLQMPVAVALIVVSMRMRTQIGPHEYQLGIPGSIMAVSGLIMFGVSLVLLLRSPFRMPIGERAFRAVWLGGFGRWFLSSAARGAAGSASSGVSHAAAGPTVSPPPTTAAAASVEARSAKTPTLDDLDQRLRALEEWRRTH